MDMTAKAVKVYDEIAQEYAKKIGVIPSVNQFELFKKYVPKGSVVLDAGCAAGRDCGLLSSNGYKVTGVDLSKNLLAIAKRENPDLHFELGDIRAMPFGDTSFDAIWANAVIHHLTKEDIEQTLREFYRVLKPGGIVFVATKRGEGTWKVKESFSFNKEREFTLLTAQELIDMFAEAGFKKKELVEIKTDHREIMWIRGIYEKV
jgi:ubiquinone/menaquinone biosynthesis C-methylase UbiE